MTAWIRSTQPCQILCFDTPWGHNVGSFLSINCGKPSLSGAAIGLSLLGRKGGDFRPSTPPAEAQAADTVRSSPVQGKLVQHNAIWDAGMISMSTVTLISAMGRAAFHLTPIL